MKLNFEKPTIFIDADGVCADFEKFYEEAFEHRHDSVSDAEMWKNINAHGKFFSSLPLIAGTLEFIRTFGKTHDIVILTACPKSDYQRAALQKKEWFKTFVDPNLMVLPVLGGKNKYLFMQKTGDILIDDFDKNIVPWIDAGGFGVVHTDWKTTTETVAKYLYTPEFFAKCNGIEDRLDKLGARLEHEGQYVEAMICRNAVEKLKEQNQ